MELSSLLEQTPYLFFVVITAKLFLNPQTNSTKVFWCRFFTKKGRKNAFTKPVLPQRLDDKVECIVGKGHAVLGQGLCSPRVYAAQALLYEVEVEVGVAVGFQVA